MARMKSGSPFLYHDYTDEIIGVKNADGSEIRFGGMTLAVTVNRPLSPDDNGNLLDCVNADLTITVPQGLPVGFSCLVIPGGTTTFASSGGTLLNGATTSVTRAAASNATVTILTRANNAGYLITGT